MDTPKFYNQVAIVTGAGQGIGFEICRQLALQGAAVLLNDIDFNGVHENGIPLDRITSDISATNGVLHSAIRFFELSEMVRLRG